MQLSKRKLAGTEHDYTVAGNRLYVLVVLLHMVITMFPE
jgi:hypothetical protein